MWAPEHPVRLQRSSFPSITSETIQIMTDGRYTNRKNEVVDIKEQMQHCIDHTEVIKPDHISNLENAKAGKGIIELTRETTVGAAYRLVVKEGLTNTIMLNFANAFKPGGGWDGLARAQEESIVRSSTLIASISKQREFYDYHIDKGSVLASDYMIISDSVPIFRDDLMNLLDESFSCSVITSAAVEANMYTGEPGEIAEAMESRIRKIIMRSIERNYKSIVLGAFGCGAFGNDVFEIAKYFKKVLIDEGMSQYFDKVVFAIISFEEDKYQAFSTEFNIPIPPKPV